MAELSDLLGCVHHSGMEYVYVCMRCDEELACIKCIVDIHRGHSVTLLDDFLPEKKQELQLHIDQLYYTDNPKAEESIISAEDKIYKNRAEFGKLRMDIRDHGEKMKDDIDQYTDKLVKLCNDLEKTNEQMISLYKNYLQNFRDGNKSKIEHYRQTLRSGTAVVVMATAKEARHNLNDVPTLGRLQTAEFNHGPQTTGELEHVFGYLTVNVVEQQYRPKVQTTVISEFEHKSLISICRAAVGQVWVSFHKDSIIYGLDQHGDVKQTVTCKVNVRNISVSPTTGRLWICCKDDYTIREVMDRHTILTRFVTENKPLSLCVTMNNTIVVGMKWGIKMYTTDGQDMKPARAKGPYKQKALFPRHLDNSTLTGDIAAADSDGVKPVDYIAGRKPSKHPHVLVMDRHLNLKFRYPGRVVSGVGSSLDTSESAARSLLFLPGDVCFDGNGDVLVAEVVTKSIQLIDGHRGDHLRTIHMDATLPQSISLKSDGTLWVGLHYQKIKVLMYKHIS